ncbi:MAG: hypothetical protein E7346_06900 [Clostridiales bacterium]|nr:hypothetical protein [Clostridiales bacterium]
MLKTENELSYILLTIITAFTYLIWLWGTSILEKIFKYDLVKMGSPIKPCPKCGVLVNMQDKKEWEELTLLQKKSWAFRRYLATSKVLTFFALLCAVFVVTIFFAPIFILPIYFIYRKWQKHLNSNEIIISISDYSLIEESCKRLQINNPITETSKIRIKETGEIITDFQCSLEDLIRKAFPLLSSQSVEMLYNIISNTVNKYNLDNGTNHKKTNVAEVFFYNFGNEINNYITSDNLQNGCFGIITILVVCCMMLSDKAYSRLKKSQTLWNDAKSCFQDNISDNLKNSFLKTMDYCYLMWHLDKISSGETIEELNNQLDGEVLFGSSVVTFAKEKNLSLKSL